MTVLDERFWSKVEKTDTCWNWKASLFGGGYGSFRLHGRRRLAHRVAYEALVGAIEKPTLDHLCRNRRCVNPAHLEPTTMRENTLRGETLAAKNAAKTSCYRGHQFTPENTLIKTQRGIKHRVCRECERSEQRLRYKRNMLRALGEEP